MFRVVSVLFMFLRVKGLSPDWTREVRGSQGISKSLKILISIFFFCFEVLLTFIAVPFLSSQDLNFTPSNQRFDKNYADAS